MRRLPIRAAMLCALAAPAWATALVMAPSPARAQSNDLLIALQVCADPDRSAHDHRTFCRRALETGELPPKTVAQVWVNYGVATVELGDLNDGLMAYTRAIVADPTLLQAYLNRASINMTRKKYDQALADFDAVLARDERNIEARLGRGLILLEAERPDLALAEFDLAVTQHPRDSQARFNRGVAYHNLGYYAEAEADFSAVISRSPNDVRALVNRGRSRSVGGMDGAQGDFDAAIELAPEWSAAWFARGQYYDLVGDAEAANRDFRRAYELGHQDPWLVQRMREISG